MEPKDIRTIRLGDPEAQKFARVGDPEAFKFIWPDEAELFKPVPKVRVRNKSGSWYGLMPLTDALRHLFAGSKFFYVEAIPQAAGNLYLIKFLDDQHWEADEH